MTNTKQQNLYIMEHDYDTFYCNFCDPEQAKPVLVTVCYDYYETDKATQKKALKAMSFPDIKNSKRGKDGYYYSVVDGKTFINMMKNEIPNFLRIYGKGHYLQCSPNWKGWDYDYDNDNEDYEDFSLFGSKDHRMFKTDGTPLNISPYINKL